MPKWSERWLKSAADLFALPPDALLRVPRFSCVNGEDIVIENVIALRSVDADHIEVEVDSATVVVEGADFVVTLVTDREVHVHGELRTIHFRRNGVIKA